MKVSYKTKKAGDAAARAAAAKEREALESGRHGSCARSCA